MPDYMMFMHSMPEGSGGEGTHLEWDAYIAKLQAAGGFQGGSAIGPGACFNRDGDAPPVTAHITGFMRISATSLKDAEALLSGNPVLENGGTIEVRELRRG
jgi:hypothetical protein